MANERVKWIKLATDLFDDEKIMLIDGLPKSDAVIVIWIKLLCLAGKQNNGGVFLMNGKTPYTEEMLALLLRRPLQTVRHALEIFRSFGMIEMVEGVITIPNWNKHQSPDLYERKKERDRLYQAKRRAAQQDILAGKSSEDRLTNDDSSGDASPPVAIPEREEEKEREKDKEEDREEEREQTPSVSQPEGSSGCPYEEIRDLYHRLCTSFPRLRSIEGERKQAVKDRWNRYPSLETFEELFRVAESSPFLKGQNDRGWQADFDWMMKESNFLKILEGKYNGRAVANAGWRDESYFSDPSAYENMQPL